MAAAAADAGADAPPSTAAALLALLLRRGAHVAYGARAEVRVDGEAVPVSEEEVQWAQGAVARRAAPGSAGVVDGGTLLCRRPDLPFDAVYETIRELGTGATAEVRLVRHRATGAEYAAKLVRVESDMKDDIDDSVCDVAASSQPRTLRAGQRVWAPARRFADLSLGAAAALGGARGDVPLCGYVAVVGAAPRGEAYGGRDDWVGVTLDLPLGAHDGSVGGKRVFSAEAGHGAFVGRDDVEYVRPGLVDLITQLRHAHILRFHDWRAPRQSYRAPREEGVPPAVDWQHPVYKPGGGNTLTMIMECCRGGDLTSNSHVLAPGGRADEVAVARTMHGVTSAVQYLHSKGVIHHDLKEDNVLLADPLPEEADDGEGVGAELAAHARVCDFGISKLASDPAVHGGTPGYMAPELFAALNHAGDWGAEWGETMARHGIDLTRSPPYGTAIDCYALGVMLYRLLSGDRLSYAPHESINYMAYDSWEEANQEALRSLLQNSAEPVFGPAFDGVSATGLDLIRGLLRPNPAQRLTAAAALQHPWFAEQLAEAPATPVRPAPPPAPRPSQPAAASGPPRARRTRKHETLGTFLLHTPQGKKCAERVAEVAQGQKLYVRLPSQLSSFQRLSVHEHCGQQQLQTRSVDLPPHPADPTGRPRRALFVWKDGDLDPRWVEEHSDPRRGSGVVVGGGGDGGGSGGMSPCRRGPTGGPPA